ncbi:MAG: helix-turn-helix domain-containing protein [Patescibacteria group bacterium]
MKLPSQDSVLQASLEAIGLSEKEAKIYITLVKFGTLTLSMLGRHAGLKRGIVYDLTKKLMTKGIVSLFEKDKKLVAQAQPPENLRALAEAQEMETKLAKKQLEQNIVELKNIYENINLKPNISYLIGDTSIDFLHNDILSDKKTVFLVRSLYDRIMREDILYYISKRAKLGILTEITAPKDPNRTDKELLEKHPPSLDKKRLLIRKWLPRGEYDSPIAIQVYGNKLSFINYRENRKMGLLIEDKDIAESIRQILQALRKRLD